MVKGALRKRTRKVIRKFLQEISGSEMNDDSDDGGKRYSLASNSCKKNEEICMWRE